MHRPWLVSIAISILFIVLVALALSGHESLIGGVAGLTGTRGGRSIEASTSLTYTVSLAGVQRDWPTFATPTVTPTPSVTITDTAVPTITLELSDIGVVAGGSLTATWQIGGPAEQYALLLRAREPGEVYAPGGPLMQSGMAPATGSAYYLMPDLSWTLTDTVYLGPGVSSSVAVTLPTVSEGEWRIEALLRNAATGEVAAVDGVALLAANRPAMLLRLSRLIANSGDRVRAELLTAAGSSPQPIKIAAFLAKPDGASLSLPTLDAGLSLAYQGVSINGKLTLLDQDLAGFGPGEYQVQARAVYSNSQGRLISMAVGAFSVCDTPAVVSGTVFAAGGQPLGGGIPRFAGVTALDVDDGAATGASTIDASGAYSVTLLPGRYLLSARVLDGAGLHSASDAQLLKIGCGGIATTHNMTATAPMPLAAAPLSAAAPLATGQPSGSLGPVTVLAGGGDGIPKPQAFVAYSNQGLEVSVASGAFDLFFGSLTRQALQQVEFTTPSSIQAALFPAAQRQALGDDTVDITELAGALNQRFTISLKFEKTQAIKKVTVAVVDTLHSQQLYAREQLVSGNTDDAWLDAADALGNALATRDVYRLLDDARDRPIKPRLTTSVSPSSVPPGATITVTITLKDADGTPAQGKTVSLDHQTPTGRESIAATTDADGSYSAQLAVGDTPGVGQLAAYFMGRDRQTANPSRAGYRITGPADLSMTSTKVRLRSGETAPVCDTLTNSGVPRAGALVTMTTRLGSLDLYTVTTGADGQGCATYTASSSSGIETVAAVSARPANADAAQPTASLPFIIDGDVALYLTPGATTLENSDLTSVAAAIRVGDAAVPAVPMQFSLAGDGALNTTSAQTDVWGQATVYYQAPASGVGTTVLTVVATVESASYTKTVTLSYRPATCQVGPGVPLCYDVTQLPFGITPIRLRNDGRVYGVYYTYHDSSYGVAHLTVWQNGTVTDLGVLTALGGVSYVEEVADVNDSGVAVGTVREGPGYEARYAVKWQNGEVYRSERTGKALAVNNNADAVGWVGDRFWYAPYLWEGENEPDASGIITGTALASGPYGWGMAYDINNSRTVAANFVFTTPSVLSQAGTWRNGTVTRVGYFDNGSVPTQINDAGYVVGNWWQESGNSRGFFWDGSHVTDLAVMPSASAWGVSAAGVNSSGSVVGKTGVGPFLWMNGTMYDLSRMVDLAYGQYGLQTAGALAINDTGQILIGDAYSYLLTPRP